MGTALRLELGGQVTLTSAPRDLGGRPMRLSVYGPLADGPIADEYARATVEVLLYPGEVRQLVIELLGRLKGGDDVARLPIPAAGSGAVWTLALDRLVDLVCGETVAPPPPPEAT
jgi:hypothetical protein